RPDIQAAPDMTRDAVFLRQFDQMRDLDAVGINAMAAPVDHARPDHDTADAFARACQHRAVDCDAHHALGQRFERAVLVEDRIAVFAGGAVGHHAGSAGVYERLAGTAEALDDGFDGK